MFTLFPNAKFRRRYSFILLILKKTQVTKQFFFSYLQQNSLKHQTSDSTRLSIFLLNKSTSSLSLVDAEPSRVEADFPPAPLVGLVGVVGCDENEPSAKNEADEEDVEADRWVNGEAVVAPHPDDDEPPPVPPTPPPLLGVVGE